MEKEAKRASKLEQRVGIVAGGLAARQDKLRGEAEEAWQALRAAATELECFRWGPGGACAQCRASAAVPRSVWQELACMKSPVLLGMLKRIARQRVKRWWRWAPHADCCISPGTQLTRRSRDGYAGASGATPGRPSPAVHLPDKPAALPSPRRALHENEQRAAPERIEELQALVAAQAAREKDLQVRPFLSKGPAPLVYCSPPAGCPVRGTAGKTGASWHPLTWGAAGAEPGLGPCRCAPPLPPAFSPASSPSMPPVCCPGGPVQERYKELVHQRDDLRRTLQAVPAVH